MMLAVVRLLAAVMLVAVIVTMVLGTLMRMPGFAKVGRLPDMPRAAVLQLGCWVQGSLDRQTPLHNMCSQGSQDTCT